ncbi:MAG TPA: histidine kinase [Pseudonocardiaceae bacterium]|nr:histidine kinase [Pseudonocardiaceae bacterium]
MTAAAVVGAAGTLAGDYLSGTARGLLVLDLVVGVVACCLMPLVLRRPVPVTLAVIVLAAAAGTASPAVSIGLLAVATQRPFRVAVSVGVAGIAAHAIRGLWWPLGGLSFGWWLVLVAFAHAALIGWGALAQARAALIESLRDRAERAEAEQGRRVAEARAAERARIAREMHDVLAHRLSLLATYAGALEYRPDMAPERLSMAAGVIRATVHQALEELRDVISVLRDDSENADGTAPPVPALADLPVLVAESRAVGTPVEVRDGLADPTALPGVTGRTAYRVVQEALTNARKHAPGQPVCIALDGEPGARLVIDVRNALGTDSAIPGSGSGLVGLTERVRLAGGQLDHRATSDEFHLRAWLPWPS